MEISAEIRSRIEKAADKLFAEARGKKLPIVSAVRQRARTDMNATSLVMAEWRAAKSRAVSVVSDIPENVRLAHDASLESLWSTAQAQAGEAFAHARLAWEQEKAELVELRRQVSEAFDEQAVELEKAQSSSDFSSARVQTLARELKSVRDALAHARLSLARLTGANEELKRGRAGDDVQTKGEANQGPQALADVVGGDEPIGGSTNIGEQLPPVDQSKGSRRSKRKSG